jgi:hypothetical protein
MAKIYKKTDRIKVKIDDVIVTLSPLTLAQKQEGQSLIIEGQTHNDPHKASNGIFYLIKCALKDIKGVEDQDGNEYKLSFENGMVSDECFDELLNLEIHQKLMMVCSSLAVTVPNEFKDQNGKPIDGVEILKNDKLEKPNPN